jgi:hypothetical protein
MSNVDKAPTVPAPEPAKIKAPEVGLDVLATRIKQGHASLIESTRNIDVRAPTAWLPPETGHALS